MPQDHFLNLVKLIYEKHRLDKKEKMSFLQKYGGIGKV
jgi:hypothetical protein